MVNSKQAEKFSSRLPYLIIGLVVGVAFAVIDYFYIGNARSDSINRYAFIAFIFLSVNAFVLLLGWKQTEKKRLIQLSLVVSIILSAIAFWVFSQLPDTGVKYYGDQNRIGSLVTAIITVTFIVIPYIQNICVRRPVQITYKQLFNYSWNSTIIIFVAWVIVGLVWMLLGLCIFLFSILDLELLKNIIQSSEFVLFSLPFLFSIGVAFISEQEKIINTGKRITLVVFQILSPMIAVIAILYTITMPFTADKEIWRSEYVSSLLFLPLLVLIIFNAVYQDGQIENKTKPWLRILLQLAVLTMPVISLTVFIIIFNQTDKEGLFPEMIFNLISAVLLFSYGLAYSISMFLRTDIWMQAVQKINIVLSVIIISVAILLHTPVLDPLQLSARSHYQRFVNNQVNIESYNFSYLVNVFGRAGYNVMQSLKGLKDHPEYELLMVKINEFENPQIANPPLTTIETPQEQKVILVVEDFEIHQSDFIVTEKLLATINKLTTDYTRRSCFSSKDCLLFVQNMDDDPDLEVMFYNNEHTRIVIFDRENGIWKQAAFLNTNSRFIRDDIINSIKTDSLDAYSNRYRNLRFKSHTYKSNK